MEELRNQIDEIDQQLLQLLAKRLDVSKKIGDYKKNNGLPVKDIKREELIIEKRSKSLAALGYDDAAFVKKLLNLLFEKSREVQK